MATTSQRLLDSVQTLPEPLLAEVLDFADFLRAKHERNAKIAGYSAAISLASLCGGLENTKAFVGSPLTAQQKPRDEWR